MMRWLAAALWGIVATLFIILGVLGPNAGGLSIVWWLAGVCLVLAVLIALGSLPGLVGSALGVVVATVSALASLFLLTADSALVFVVPSVILAVASALAARELSRARARPA